MSRNVPRSTSVLVLLHFVGNALLLGLGYYWLGLGESSGTRLVWSFFVAAVFVCLSVWLHGRDVRIFPGQRQFASDGRLPSAFQQPRPLDCARRVRAVFLCVARMVAPLQPAAGLQNRVVLDLEAAKADSARDHPARLQHPPMGAALGRAAGYSAASGRGN